MRARLALAFVLLAAPALAEPVAGPSASIEVARLQGAIFAGLSQDGDAVLVTNLADGRLYRRGPDGAFVAFGPVFPHGTDAFGDPDGPYRVERVGGRFIVAQGWTPVEAIEGPLDHALVEVGADGNAKALDADFWNPFSFVANGETLYIVDAAKNAIERRAADGTRTTLATFPRLVQRGAAMQTLSPTEFSAQKPYEVDAVPTGIAHRDGRLYVSLFGGFPYIAGRGAVVSIEPTGGGQRTEGEKFDMPVGVAFDGLGRIMVLEHGTFDQAKGFVPGSGRLVRIDPRSRVRETLIGGLTRPAAVLALDATHFVVSELGGTLIYLIVPPN
ncbi:ScyD/ScyE family protein [soil metagenome]